MKVAYIKERIRQGNEREADQKTSTNHEDIMNKLLMRNQKGREKKLIKENNKKKKMRNFKYH